MDQIRGRILSAVSNTLVLIADDEPANLFFVRQTLAAAGWHVAEASDGFAAIDIARQQAPALILMDIEMPECDGIDATRAIRASGGGMPILAYSMRRMSGDDVRSYGMDGRIPKPCPPATLLATVEQWCPVADVNGSKRLAAEFGADEVAGLVDNLREQLVDALDHADPAAIAHRIAGVAGTLGFADVSASWLRLSEGEEAALDDARRDARIAIAAVDRDRRSVAPSR